MDVLIVEEIQIILQTMKKSSTNSAFNKVKKYCVILQRKKQHEDDEKESIGNESADSEDIDSEDNNGNTSDNDNNSVFKDFVDIYIDESMIEEENFEHINFDRKVLYEGCDIINIV